MTDKITFEHLATHCLFCDPAVHGQDHQIILRSDNFYLFAGLGAIIPGYIIITPYKCDDPGRSAQCLADLSKDMLDELLFLRDVVARFYRSTYGNSGLSFEHGRAGVCNGPAPAGDTIHCYHAHLCCYPATCELWSQMPLAGLVEPRGLADLRRVVAGNPYLYMEVSRADPKRGISSGGRQEWSARALALGSDEQLEAQFLRRQLARQLERPEIWDWREYPKIDSALELVKCFKAWIQTQGQYVLSDIETVPSLSFQASVERSTEVGNDFAAAPYDQKWGEKLQQGVIGRLLAYFDDDKSGTRERLRLLDAGCGPGNYLRVFYHLGFECYGFDPSSKMIDLTQTVMRTQPVSNREDATPAPDVRKSTIAEAAYERESFDVVWCSAVCVHVPRTAVVNTMSKLRSFLTPDGVMYLSAQIGVGLEVRYEGRVFVYFSRDEFRSYIRAAGLDVIEEWEKVSKVGTFGDTMEKPWMHFLVRRAPPQLQASAHTMGGLGEVGIHERIGALLPQVSHASIKLGFGDDCAAFEAPPDHWVVSTTDPCPTPVLSILRGPDRVVDGWFTMIISLSDLASMGARPLGMMLALEAPEETPLVELDAFYQGVSEAALKYQCPIIGGNIKDANKFLCVGTAFGLVKPDQILRRDAAKPNEWVVVLGEMGRFWAGVLHFMEHFSLTEAQTAVLLESMRRPRPRLLEGCALAEQGLSRCAMDSSDGLTACFREIARSSPSIDILIELDRLAPEPIVQEVAVKSGIHPHKLMLAWGDWELVCTVAHDKIPSLHSAMAELGCPVTVVGRTLGNGNGRVLARDGEREGPLANLASERFTSSSYFSYGLGGYVRRLRNTSLILPDEPHRDGAAGSISSSPMNLTDRHTKMND
jgi:thiamine-monophosphate kinase